VTGPFSRRSAFPRQENRWERARAKSSGEGRTFLDLTESNPTRAGLPVPTAAIAALSRSEAARYAPEPFGLPAAREAIRALHASQGLDVAVDRIALTASTSEAYAFLFKLLCDPGDEVLIPRPSYPLFEHLSQLEGVHARSYPLAYDGRWHVDMAALAAARTPRTRAIVVVHPNNPTGSYLKREELDAIAALGLPIVSDEVFATYTLSTDTTRAGSALECGNSLVFTLHGLSKLAGLPQLKLSWLCIGGPDALAREAAARLELIADSFLSVSTPVQLALAAILAEHGALRHAIHARLRENLSRLHAACTNTPATPLHVEGGWYAVLRLPSVLDDEAWGLLLRLRHGPLRRAQPACARTRVRGGARSSTRAHRCRNRRPLNNSSQ
jgi:alanine-synthesizing transaminase